MHAGSQGYICNLEQEALIILKYQDILTYYFTALSAPPHFFLATNGNGPFSGYQANGIQRNCESSQA